MTENISIALPENRSNHDVNDRLIYAGAVAAAVGYGLIVAALIFQRSATASIFGMYSVKYAGLLVVLLLGGVAGVAGLVVYWRRLPDLVVGGISKIPPGLFDLLLVMGAIALGWVWLFPIFGILAHPAFLAGTTMMYVGLLGGGFTTWLSSTRSLMLAIGSLTTSYGLFVLWAILYPQPFSGSGLLLVVIPAVVSIVYGLVFAAVQQVNLKSITMARDHTYLLIALAIGVLSLYVIYTYRGAFLHNMGDDELIYIHFMKQTSFVQLFTESPVPFIYRPLYGLEIKLYYFLFGIDHAKYLAAAIAIYVTSIVLLVRVLRLAGGGLGIAFAAVLALPAHTFASDFLSVWPAEIVMFIGVITTLVLMLCLRPRHSWKWYLGLFGLLFIALLSKEYSFAIVGSVMFYAAIGFFTRTLEPRQAAWIFVICIAVTALYFVLRLHALNTVLGSTVDEETCGPLICYTSEQLAQFTPQQHWLLYAYTVIGPNFLGNFFPFFANDGDLMFPIITLWGVLLTCAIIGLVLTQIAFHLNERQINERKKNLKKMLGLLLGLVVCSLGLALPAWGGWVSQLSATPQQLALAVHGVVVIILGIAYTKIGALENHEVLAVALAIGLMLASSVAAYPYARYRTHYLALFGWAIIFVIAFRHTASRPLLSHLRISLLVSLFALVMVNSIRVDRALPAPALLPESFQQTASYMCNPEVVDEQMVRDIATRYNINWADIQDCRQAFLTEQ